MSEVLTVDTADVHTHYGENELLASQSEPAAPSDSLARRGPSQLSAVRA